MYFNSFGMTADLLGIDPFVGHRMKMEIVYLLASRCHMIVYKFGDCIEDSDYGLLVCNL